MNKDSLDRFLRPQEAMYETALEELELLKKREPVSK